MKNYLGFDLEFWYSGEPYSKHLPDNVMDNINEDIQPIIKLLNKHETNVTFFTLGYLAEQYPELIKELHENGHEIASHGYLHKRLCEMDPVSFNQDIKKSINIIKTLTNQSPYGYRAPHYSLTNYTIWALDILIKNNFKYDSSIVPVNSHLQSKSYPPRYPYKISSEDITKIDTKSRLWEFPICPFKIIKNIPFSIGTYFRIIPYTIYKLIITKNNKNGPVTFCFHPWECNSNTARMKLKIPHYFLSYYGIRSSLKKIDKLLYDFNFSPIKYFFEI